MGARLGELTAGCWHRTSSDSPDRQRSLLLPLLFVPTQPGLLSSCRRHLTRPCLPALQLSLLDPSRRRGTALCPGSCFRSGSAAAQWRQGGELLDEGPSAAADLQEPPVHPATLAPTVGSDA